jgi:hypothetical protein
MYRIDVKLSDDIQQQLAIPACVDLELPKPKLPKIQLPTGGTIKGIADLTKGVPSDCSLNFSLAIQLAPIMASIECLVKVLALIAPLIDVIKALAPPDLLALGKAVPKFLDAAKDVVPCLAIPTPVAMIPFVKDILALIIAMLRCLVQELRSNVHTLVDLELKIRAFRASGNVDTLSSLECARGNAQSAMASTMIGIEPIGVLISLAGSFMKIIGVPAVELPVMGSPDDLAAVNKSLDDLQQVINVLQAIVDAPPLNTV